jgi:hypothetical protein
MPFRRSPKLSYSPTREGGQDSTSLPPGRNRRGPHSAVRNLLSELVQTVETGHFVGLGERRVVEDRVPEILDRAAEGEDRPGSCYSAGATIRLTECPTARVCASEVCPGRSARSLPEGRSLALRERERARDQASGRARIRASRSPVRPPGRRSRTSGSDGLLWRHISGRDAAVDQEGRPVDVGGLVGGEKERGVGDLLGPGEAAGRNVNHAALPARGVSEQLG